ncbi:MAG TPA: non-homologous end-joining DNA ligase [Candidatus Udaeobacter sp.]|jgi:bifunctional non-homologous end joining protein LigD|nr:non-homologous end-joining DNA ligase [Candidatus Udaeobacter sp.]
MGLREYKRKRDFSTTSEPKGGKPKPKTVRGSSRFVIQKHDARRLHYDFRLEMEGVLKSWAVPKGLPWKQGEKHLAVEVEDHPVDYAEFEGTIPEGQYGGGTVMVWDCGKYFVYGEQPLKSLRDGKLHLVLEGEKAKGEWTLVRIRGRDGEKNQWLILKTGADAKAPSKKAEDQSVKTGRTMKQIAEARDAEWETNREDKDASATSKFKARIRAALKKKEKDETGSAVRRDGPEPEGQRARRRTTSGNVPGRLGEPSLPNEALPDLPSAKSRFIEPMKAKLVEKPPTTGDWIYELKFDGFRAVAVKIDNRVSLYSRNERKLDARFPEIVDAIKQIPARECVIDGEIVAVDEEGRSSFQLLQAREMEGKKSPLYFYAFDLPQLEGKNLMSLPLEARKNTLEQLCAAVAAGADRGSLIRFSGAIGGDAGALLKEIKKRGLEGIIGKQRNSIYEQGRRSGAWIKLKCVSEQEFVIGGYTPPQGSRKYFGAILVGYYKDKKKEGDSRLVFAGKVGTGFTAKSLSMLHKKFRAQERSDCPFVDLPSKQNGEWVQGITPSMMRKMHWLNPVFVCEIKFAEWTRDKKLRAPVFLGLREDKKPSDVIREV